MIRRHPRSLLGTQHILNLPPIKHKRWNTGFPAEYADAYSKVVHGCANKRLAQLARNQANWEAQKHQPFFRSQKPEPPTTLSVQKAINGGRALRLCSAIVLCDCALICLFSSLKPMVKRCDGPILMDKFQSGSCNEQSLTRVLRGKTPTYLSKG